jgi:GPH family glycoside/pentoside/hexuronide:cation symporter
MVYSISGGMLSIILVTVLGWVITDRKLLYVLVGLGLGLVSIIPPLIVFAVTKKDDSTDLPDPLPTSQAIKETLSNKAFWLVMGLYLFSWTTASILAAVLIYFANYYLRVPEQANYFVLVSQIAAIAFIPLWVWVARKLDKRRAFIIGTATWVVVMIGIASIRPDQVYLAYILAALSGSGIATAYVLPWAMIPDIIEMDELQTGQRREGSYYAFTSFFQKLGTGAALWMLGQVLAITGYITPLEGKPLPVQPEGAVAAIRWTMGGVPVVLLALAILMAWRFPITRQMHADIRAQLAERGN